MSYLPVAFAVRRFLGGALRRRQCRTASAGDLEDSTPELPKAHSASRSDCSIEKGAEGAVCAPSPLIARKW